MNQNTVVILIALAFGAIGFTLGRVTCTTCCHPHHQHCSGDQCGAPHGHQEHEMVKEIRVMKGEGDDEMEVEVIVNDLMDSGFEGDTTIVIDGGQIQIQRDGEDVNVEVKVEKE